MNDFAHLHLHSQYSLLDGAIKMKDVVERSHALGMKSVAVTDHGNMFGAIDFYKRAKAFGIKPILGCEAYIAGAPKGSADKHERKAYHMILLAKNQEGYQNLKKLVSKAYLEGYYYYPRIDKKWLREHSRGLYALSACLGGEVPQRYMHEGPDRAREVVREYAAIFEPGHFHLELQDNKMQEQIRVNNFYKELARAEGFPLVATNDAHYLNREDAKAHEILMCIQMGNTLQDNTRMRHQTDELFLKSPQQMWQSDTFSDCPEALENTIKIAQACQVDLDLGKVYLPNFKVPEGMTREYYLELTAKAGLERRLKEFRYSHDRARYFERLEFELSVINKMGFAGYFLIVWDFINFSKQSGIPVGPGRGSGAGSLVAFSLRITDLDPIPYDLLFERFLNPERISMPDFDIDFCQERRGEVIDYVTQKYGHENVAQIITFSQLSAKSVIKDVARVMGVPFQEANEITKLIPGLVDGKKVSLDKAMELEPRLKTIQEEKPIFKEIIDISHRLEGLNRQAGIHAAGIVIGDHPLEHYVPLYRGLEKFKDPHTGKEVEKQFRVTQFAKDEVEQAGLVKFDFLGLKTLTVIDQALRLVGQRITDENAKLRPRGLHPHVTQEAALPITPLSFEYLTFDDPKVFELCSEGDTDGVFQMESSGFKELLKRLKPDRFEDLIAAGALYRPGPLDAGLVDDYIDRKHGRKPTSYLHPSIEGILKPTYGVIVYQEQVMLIAVNLCGFTMGQSDTLRKAMGKKNPEVMAKMRKDFVEGGVQKSGLDRELLENYFTLIEKFAGYAFNKSHSAAYAVLTYQTALLKAYYPAEFMAALLSTEMSSTDNIVKYVSAAKDMDILVLPPDVNASEAGFSAPMGQIRFGLAAIKGIGQSVVDAILKARQAGAFKNLFDFCERVDHQHINKKGLEALIESGACDSFLVPRAAMFAVIERALTVGAQTQKDKKSGQGSLFDMLMSAPNTNAPASTTTLLYPNIDEWDSKDKLKREKASLGFFLSAHPLSRYANDLKRLTNCTTLDLPKKEPKQEITLAGIVTAMRERPLKDGSGRMCFLTVEDLHGSVEVIVFSKVFADSEVAIKSEEPLLIKGRVMQDGDDDSVVYKIRAEQIGLLGQVRYESTQKVHLDVPGALLNEEKLNKLNQTLSQCQGSVPVSLDVTLEQGVQVHLALRQTVQPSELFINQIEKIFAGESVLRLLS